MGTCLSKKKPKPSTPTTNLHNPLSSSLALKLNNGCAIAVSPAAQPSAAVVPLDPTPPKPKKEKQHDGEGDGEGEDAPAPVKKEVFLIKHRRSHDDRERNSKPPIEAAAAAAAEEESEPAVAAVVRTSSCTKEEVDAILIQCGRLSRSSSGKAASSSASIERGGGRRYSGSKRSFDFDHCGGDGGGNGGEDSAKNEGGGGDDGEEKRGVGGERHGRHRRSARGSPSPQGRRRTPSREREQGQRSSSRERRVSRSPARRGGSSSSSAEAGESGGTTNRPGKMVSVPATVSSLVMDRSNNGEPAPGAVIKRISVKRNVGEAANSAASRGAASPRSQSPARANGGNAKSSSESQQQQAPSLSRNPSRKAEQSPYRRNPLSEVDPNSLAYPQPHNNSSNRSQSRGKREAEGDEIIVKEASNVPYQAQKPNNPGANQRTSARVSTDNKSTQQQATVETTVVISGSDTRPQAVTRSRSARRSRDFDFTPEALLNSNPTPSYTRLLLEDIQNFHQKNTNTTTTVVSLPPCVSKACSILEAVADLNNNSAAASSNLSCAFSEDHHHYSKASNNNNSSLLGPKDPFVESEVVGCDDLMEPSFHKYVTVRRGTGGVGVDAADDQESSGSNSFAGSSSQLNHWGGLSSSSWEPNSAESTDRRTSRSGAREDDKLSAGRKRESYSSQQHSGGIGRGRLGSAKGLHTAPVVAST